jgi:hypothetical protein
MDRAAAPLAVLVSAIAKELGAAWSVRPQPEESRNDGHADLVGPDGSEIAFQRITWGAGRGKLSVGGRFADWKVMREELRHRERQPSISVSEARPPAQIAADIRRPLLPGLAELVARCNARVASTTAHQNAVGGTAARIVAATGAQLVESTKWREVDPGRPELHVFDDHRIDMRVWTPGYVTFCEFSVTEDEALAVLAALAASRRKLAPNAMAAE